MKKLILPILFVGCAVTAYLSFSSSERNVEVTSEIRNDVDSEHGEKHEEGEISKETRIKEAFEYINEITKDPALGYPPTEELLNVNEQIRVAQEAYRSLDPASRAGTLVNAKWRERGPNNISGRTRSLLVDKNDSSGKTIFAGGVSGGIWKTTDITESRPNWTPIDEYLQNLSITCISQDPTNYDKIYAGTGESPTGIRGFGILKSEDGGASWAFLPSTQGIFQFTQSIIVAQNGDVYVASSNGLRRSQDGGVSWEKVLGSGFPGIVDDFFNTVKQADDGTIIASNNSQIWKSLNGNPGEWTNISLVSNGFGTGLSRLIFDVSPTNSDIVYAVGAVSGGAGSPLYRTSNGGATWSASNVGNGANFARDQAWYDLSLVVNPNNPNSLFVGGIDLYRSGDGGLSFVRISSWTGADRPYVHADQHYAIFDRETPNLVYFTNDGGVFRSEDNGTNFQFKGNNYNVTQFYACAIHPGEYEDHFLAGAQDNGSILVKSNPGIGSGVEVQGGDGFYCHIDQNEPQYQIVSLYFADYALSDDGGQSFGAGGITANGAFNSPSDYDDVSNILYTQTYDGDFYRWKIDDPQNPVGEVVNITSSFNVAFTNHFSVSPNVPNRLYIGDSNGRVYQIDNAHQGTSVSANVFSKNFGGTVSCIAIEPGNENHILVTVSNYGVISVHESTDGGNSFSSVEGNLPNMPVYWTLFNPNDATQAILATEAGVWSTDLLDGNSTQWDAPNLAAGTPNTRVTMLQTRTSDKFVLAATYGRGMFTTDIFADPKARLLFEQVQYTESNIAFNNFSVNSTSWLWEFGDGSTSNNITPTKTYTSEGTYDVSLTINNDPNLKETKPMYVLPDRDVPYTEALNTNYGGGFETNQDDFAAYTISGTPFERGNSTFVGKDGTHSGDFAWVLGLNVDRYESNSHSMLYTPNYDLSEPGLYEISFWAKYQFDASADGFNVEFSTDRGESWSVLGEETDEWYNFSSNSSNAAFGANVPYFATFTNGWQQFRYNLGSLAGEENVAFRFVFKSNNSTNFIGLVLDDVEVTKYEGTLETNVVSFEGEFKPGNEIDLVWKTEPEFQLDHFELEISEYGGIFDFVANIDAIPPGSSINERVYEYTDLSKRKDRYFYKLKVVGTDTTTSFYTPTITVARTNDDNFTDIFSIFPTVFSNEITISFTNTVDAPVKLELYNALGQLVVEDYQVIQDVEIALETPILVTGAYFLSITIGEDDPITKKVISRGR